MCCPLILLATLGPRITLFIMWMFTTYLSRAYQTGLMPLLGFIFLPYTTIFYAIGVNNFGPGLQGMPLVLFVIGILCDFGVIGGAAKARRREET